MRIGHALAPLSWKYLTEGSNSWGPWRARWGWVLIGWARRWERAWQDWRWGIRPVWCCPDHVLIRGMGSLLPVLQSFSLKSFHVLLQPTPVFLPGKSHWQRSLAGYSPWSRKRVGHNLATEQQHISALYRAYGLVYLPGLNRFYDSTDCGWAISLPGKETWQIRGSRVYGLSKWG